MFPQDLESNVVVSGSENNQKKILYVEDNSTNLRLIENVIKQQTRHQFISAMDATTGLDLLESERPDLVLMDINLPGMDGYEALKHIQANEKFQHLPVIAVSANAMPSDLERGKAAGFRDYITKPINIRSLIHAIEEAI